MIFLILKSYAILFSLVALGSLIVFILGLYFIFKSAQSTTSTSIHSKNDVPDFSAISGEDVMLTQLDLARAYIESDRIILAKTILKSVLHEGNALHQQEAQQLLSSL